AEIDLASIDGCREFSDDVQPQAARLSLTSRRITRGPRHLVPPPVDVIDGSVRSEVAGSKTLWNANCRVGRSVTSAQGGGQGAARKAKGRQRMIHQHVQIGAVTMSGVACHSEPRGVKRS